MFCEMIKTSHCTTCNHNPLVVIKENRCSYYIQNHSSKTICKTKIDDCYIVSGERCDYLLVNCDQKEVYFVELKGCDFLKAIEQIEQTIQYFAENLSDYRICARIVATRISVPNLENNPKVLKLQRRLKKSGGDLKKATLQLTEKI